MTDTDNMSTEPIPDAFTPKTRRCEHPHCTTYTTQRLCARHRPLPPEGMWVVAAQVRAENEGKP